MLFVVIVAAVIVFFVFGNDSDKHQYNNKHCLKICKTTYLPSSYHPMAISMFTIACFAGPVENNLQTACNEIDNW